MSTHHYKVFNVDTNTIEDADLEFAWKEELASQGHATCIHSNCQLSFLSISGMVAHNKICPGFIRPSDFVPCMHCNAKFKHYKSCQTHMDRCHQETDEPGPSGNHVSMDRESNQTDRKVAQGFQTPSNRFLVSESKPGPSVVPTSARRPPRPNLPPTPNVMLPDVILPNLSSPVREPYSRAGPSFRTIPQGRIPSRRPSIAVGNIIKARAADGRIHYFRAADPASPPQAGARARREPQRLVLVEDDIRHLLPQHPLPPQSFTDATTPAASVHRARPRYSTTFKPEPSPPEPKPEVYISYGDHDYLPKSEFEETSRPSLVYTAPSRFVPLKQEDSPASRKEKFLAAQEAKISELESMAAETELLAKSRKEKELEERENKLRKWEMELQRREEEARRRLADAQMNLFDDSKTKIEKIDKLETQQRYVTSGHSGFSDLQNVILTREDLASLHPNDRPINSVVVGPREQDTWSDSSTRSQRTATAPSPSVSELTDPDSVSSSINASTNLLNSRSLNSAASCYSDGEGSSPSFSPTPHGARRTSPVAMSNIASKSSVQIIPVSSKTLPKMALPAASLQPADIIPISPIRSNASSSSTPLASKGFQSFKITPTSSFQDIRPEPLPSPFNPRKPYESFNQIIKPVSSSVTIIPSSSVTIIPTRPSVNSFSTVGTSAVVFPSSSHSTPKTACRFPLEFKDETHQFKDNSVQAPPVKRAKVHYPTTQKRPIEVPKTFKLPASAIKLQNVPHSQSQIPNISQFVPRRTDFPVPSNHSLSYTRDYFHQASFSPDLSKSCESPLVRMPSFSPLEDGHFPTDEFLTPQPFDAPPRTCTRNEIATSKSSETLFPPSQSEFSDSIRALESSQPICPNAIQPNLHSSISPNATQSSLQSLISPNATQSSLQSPISPNATQSSVQSLISLNATQSSVQCLVSPNARQSSAQSPISLNATQSSLQSSVSKNATQSNLQSPISTNATQSNLQSRICLNATQSSLPSSLTPQDSSFPEEMILSENKAVNATQSITMQEPRLPSSTSLSYDGDPDTAIPQPIPKKSRYSTDVQDSPRYSKDVQDSPRYSKDVQDSPRYSKDVQDSPRYSKDVQDSPRFSKDVQDSPCYSKDVQDSPCYSKDVQDSPRYSKDVQDSPCYSKDVQDSPRYSTDVQDSPVNLSKNKSPKKVIENIPTNVATKNTTASAVSHDNYTVQKVESNTENVMNLSEIDLDSNNTKATDNVGNEVVVALGEEFNLDTNLVVNNGVKLESLLEQAAGGMLTLVADPSANGQYLILENSNASESGGNQGCPFIDASKGIDIASQGIDVLVKCDVESDAQDETNNVNLKVEKEATPERNQSCDVEKLEDELEALKSTYKSLEESTQSLLEPNSSHEDSSLTKDPSPHIGGSANQEKEERFRIFRSKNDGCQIGENSVASDSESSSKVDNVQLKQGIVKHKKNLQKDSSKADSDLNIRNRTTSLTDIAQGTFEDLEREIAKEVPEPSGDIVDYLEKRLKEFECDFTNITSMDEDNAGTQSSQAADMESEPDAKRTTRKSHRIKRRSSKLLANAETASESEAEQQSQKTQKLVTNNEKEVNSKKSNQNKAVLKRNVDDIESVTESLTNVKLSRRLEEKCKRRNRVPSPEKPAESLDTTVVPEKIGIRRSSRSRKSTTIKSEEAEVAPSRRSARISNSSLKKKQEQSDSEPESSKVSTFSTKRKFELETPKPIKRQRKESSENDEALSKRKVARLSKDKSNKSSVSLTCGKCEEVLTSNEAFQTHVATVHGGCARLQGDELGQDFTKEQEIEAWQEAFNWAANVPCPRCLSSTFTSKNGMKNHVQICNRTEAEIDAIKVDCPEPDCDERLMPQHVKSHETKHRDERRQLLMQENVANNASISITDSPGTRGKRQAAQKARKLFTELVQQMRQKMDDGYPEDDKDGEVSDDGDDENYDVYEELSVATLFRSVRDASGAKVVRCTVCTSEFDTKAKVEAHIMAEHSAELLDDQGDDTGDDWSEGSDDEDDLRGSIHSHRPRRSTGGPCSVRQRRLEPFAACVTTEAEYRHKNYFQNKFPDLSVVSSSWQPLDPHKATTFLPAAATSTRFTVRQARAKSPTVTDAEHEIRMLERLSGGYINSCPMMFTGGPVWAMAWCPLPSNCQDSSEPLESEPDPDITDQFLAVSSQHHMDSESPLHKTSGGPGLLQIWKCPGLDVKEGSAPMFSVGLAHHYGSVWCLEWCPSGMFDPPDAGTRPSDVMRRRLGGLAAACSDGTVRIFTLPHPDNLQEGQVYLREADLTLQADQGGPDLHGQCIKLSWYRGEGHNWIAASFSSGVVGLWHITTTSPLLKTSSFILPTQAWLAHTSSVTGLSLSPYGGEDPRHLLTGSTDRCYKFWDLRDTAVPLQVVKRGMVTSVSWLPGWAAGTVSHDDVYLQSHTQTLVTESGYYTSRSQPVIAQNSGVWDESVSSWTGSLAAGTSAGELIVFVLPSLDRSMEHDKICNQRRTYVFRTDVETEELPPNTDHQLYETAKQFSTLGFVDIPVLSGGAGDCPTDEMRKVRSADRMGAENLVVYPLPSVNRVRWNNNLGAHLWLASGGQAGLVRIHNVRGLQSGDVKKAIQAIDHNV